MESNQWSKFIHLTWPVLIGILSFVTLLVTMPLLSARPTLAQAGGMASTNPENVTVSTRQVSPAANNIVPTLQLLAFQPSEGEYLFTARLSGGLPDTQYVISSYHHTDIDYLQKAVTVTTDSEGVASAKIWSRCTVANTLTGTVLARLEQAGVSQTASNSLDCPNLQTIGDFGGASTIT